MKRLLKGILAAAAATGGIYLLLHVRGTSDEPASRHHHRLLDERELTSQEKEAMLRELGAYL